MQSGASAAIGMIERGRALIVDRVEGSEFVQDALQIAEGKNITPAKGNMATADFDGDRDIGVELAIHSTAMGKVLLSL